MKELDDFKLGMWAFSLMIDESSKRMFKGISKDKLFEKEVIKEMKKIFRVINQQTLLRVDNAPIGIIRDTYNNWVESTKENSANMPSEPEQEGTYTK